MDSYSSLLSPIDNFAFTQFANSSAGNSPASRGKTNSHNLQQDVPRTPLPNSNKEWQDLLDGTQAGQFSFNMWEDNPFGSDKQLSGSPWRPHVFRTLSDSFLDSPLSSSSFLSSASGSPSVLSSATCSPWQTCPGLAPVSPDIPLLDELSLGLQGSLSVSSDEVAAYGFNNLSLGSPITLSHEVDNGAVEPFHLMEPQPHVATTIEPSHLMSNALGLELTAGDNSNTGMVSSDATHMFSPFGQPVTSPPHSMGSSPLSDPGDVRMLPPLSVPSLTPTGNSFDQFPSASSAPSSDSAMYDRATRRRTSRIDYAEAAYDGDSDEDLEESAGAAGANLIRIAKRRKAASESPTFPYSESDDDAELSEFGTRRGGKKGGRRGAGTKGGSASANAKRKSKRRHHCPLDGCKQTFTRVTDMARHLGSVHRTVDTDANRCSFCHKAFSRDDAVLRHENDSCPMRPRKNNNRNEIWS